MISRLLPLVLVTWFLTASACAQRPVEATQRWALVALDQHVVTIADLLLTQLSDADDIALLERDDIKLALDELKLTGAGLVRSDARLKLGRLIQADAFVLLSQVSADFAANAPSLIRVRLIDARTSVQLLNTLIPQKELEKDVSRVGNALLSRQRRLSVDTDEFRYIGLSKIVSGEPGTHLRSYCRTLTSALNSRLSQFNNVVVLEREDLQRLTDERELTGIEQQIKASTRLVESSVRRDDDGNGMLANCRLISPADGSAKEFVVKSKYSRQSAFREAIIKSLLSHLGASDRQPATDLGSEAAEFDRRSKHFVSARRPAIAAEFAETAYALAPTTRRLVQVKSQYYAATEDHLRQHNIAGAIEMSLRHHEWMLRLLSIDANYEFKGHFANRKDPVPHPPAWTSRSSDLYESKIIATNADEKAKLTEVYQMRRKYFATKERVFADSPILQVRYLLQWLHFETVEVDGEGDQASVALDLLQRLYAAANRAGIRKELDNRYYRVMVQAATNSIERATSEDPKVRWQAMKTRDWITKLHKFEPWLAKAGILLLESRHPGPAGAKSAAMLLEHLADTPRAGCELKCIDETFRVDALNRIGDADAQAYGERILSKAIRDNDIALLVYHPRSCEIFFRGLDEQQTKIFAKKGAEFIKQFERPSSPHDLRYMYQLVDFAFSRRARDHKPDPTLSDLFVQAGGPWSKYTARPLQFSSASEFIGFKGLLVDHRPDATKRGGELVAIQGRPNRSMSIERISVGGGAPVQIGPVFEGNAPYFRALAHRVPMAIGNDAIYVVREKAGFTRVTSDSCKHFSEAEGAASNEIRSLAWMGNRLYIGYQDAFGTYDPKTDEFKLLASSTSATSKNPLDGRGSFAVWEMVPDEKRKCLWMSVSSMGASTKGGCFGLVRYNPVADEYKQYMKEAIRMSYTAEGLLVNRSVEPNVSVLDFESAKLTVMPEYSHASMNMGWQQIPRPHLIKLDGDIVRDDGSIATSDGKIWKLPKRQHWSLLAPVGDGFVTHVDYNKRQIWYVTRK